MTPSDEKVQAVIAETAAEWFLANQTGALDEDDAAAFLGWLRESPVHVREYLGVARVARHLPAAAGERQMSLQTVPAAAGDPAVVPLEDAAPETAQIPPRSARARLWPMAAALAALAAGVVWWAHDGELLGIPKTYRTAHGAQSVERLPDGSLLWLDTDSEATVRYSRAERLIAVRRGQALFEVARESRRFRVDAGQAGAIAVGTQFDVMRKSDAVEFTVARGQIAVYGGQPPWLGGSTVPADVRRVAAGYRLRVDDGRTPGQPVAVNLDQALAWQQHKIAFEHRPLGEVAAEFNRYGSIPVDIDDEALRALLVSGIFDAGDTESFVAFLQRLPGVRVERTPGRIRATRIKTTN